MTLQQKLAEYIDQNLESEEDPRERGASLMSWKEVSYLNHPINWDKPDKWIENMAQDLIQFMDKNDNLLEQEIRKRERKHN